jgi:hypothetical protein
MLESAKDRVIGVDSPRQQVPPRVWYGAACLLIRDAVESVPRSDEWKFSVVTRPGSHGGEGLWYHDYPGKPYHCYGTATTLAKPSI